MKIIKNFHITLFSKNYFNWKKSKFDLYESLIKRSADEIFIWSKKISCWKNWSVWVDDRKKCWRNLHLIEKNQLLKKLICMKSIIKKNIDEIFDWLKKLAVEKIDLYESMIKKDAGEIFRIESAVDFDAYKTIFDSNFSFVMFIFFIAVFWFFLNFVKITIFFKIDWWSTCYKNRTWCCCIQKSDQACCNSIQKLFFFLLIQIYSLYTVNIGYDRLVAKYNKFSHFFNNSVINIHFSK